MGTPRSKGPIPSKISSDLHLVEKWRLPNFGPDSFGSFGETAIPNFVHTHTHIHTHTHTHTYRHGKISTDFGFLTLGNTIPIIISKKNFGSKTIYFPDFALLRQKKIKKNRIFKILPKIVWENFFYAKSEQIHTIKNN